MDYFKFLGGRKFLLSVLTIILVVFAVPVDPQVKMDFILYVLGFYLGANALTSFSAVLKKK